MRCGRSSMKIEVTVGICVKNSEATVKESVESVISQDFPHEKMEIIVVDGKSKDRTLSIIRNSLTMSDTRVKIHSDQGKGLGVARQIVVDNASGEYIVWVDGDVVLPRNYLRKQVEFMDRNPSVGAAQGILGISGNSLVAVLENLGVLSTRYEFDDKDPHKIATYDTYRVRAIKQAGGFDECIKGSSEDRDLLYRIWKTGWLLATSHVRRYHRFRETWRDLWKEYSWWGYGEHYLHHKHRGLVILWQTVPIARALGGFRRASSAYKLTHRKISFLLPFQHSFKASAWWFGFLKSHLDAYGHRTPTKISVSDLRSPETNASDCAS